MSRSREGGAAPVRARRRGPVGVAGLGLVVAFALAPLFGAPGATGAIANVVAHPAREQSAPAQAPVSGQWYTNGDSLAELVKLAPTVAAEYFARFPEGPYAGSATKLLSAQ